MALSRSRHRPAPGKQVARRHEALPRTRVILLNKPYGVLSQFTDPDARPTLATYVPVLGVYAAGRLDRESEGLVVLTNDGRLQARLANPHYKLCKTYWVQVEGEPDELALERLCAGPTLRDGPTAPARVQPMVEPPELWPRKPPVRFRARIPTTWLQVELREGRNRQLRRMTAAVGLPTLRLVRTAIGPLTLGQLAPGSWRELDTGQVAALVRNVGFLNRRGGRP